ncbi:MAG: hypothetical protein RIT32_946 [Actinomycetota bacterium]
MISELLDRIYPFKVELKTTFRSVNHRIGYLIEGEYGFGEWAPFADYAPTPAAKWLRAALEAADMPRQEVLRDSIPVNGIVPALPPNDAVHWSAELISKYQVKALKVKVGDSDQLARVAAIRSEFAEIEIRVDANGAYTNLEAAELISEYAKLNVAVIEQPCASLAENQNLKNHGVLIALDETIRLSNEITDELISQVREIADIAVLKPIPLGGSKPTLELAERLGLPVIVSGSLDTSIGLSYVAYVAALLPTAPLPSGLGTSVLLAEDLVKTSLLPDAGLLSVAPIQPDPQLLQESTNRLSSVELAELKERFIAAIKANSGERR